MARHPAIGVLLLVAPGACCHTHWRDSTCEDRVPALEEAMEVTAYRVQGQYAASLPPGFDGKAYLALARAQPLTSAQRKALESVELEVWTKDNCLGAWVVARCPGTGRPILWDDTQYTFRIEGKDLLDHPAAPPVHPAAPPSCPVPPSADPQAP